MNALALQMVGLAALSVMMLIDPMAWTCNNRPPSDPMAWTCNNKPGQPPAQPATGRKRIVPTCEPPEDTPAKPQAKDAARCCCKDCKCCCCCKGCKK
jgi:hypothetical protein